MEFLDGETGASIKKPWRGYGTDKEDKGGYKAMTGGEKYFLLKTFLIPTGDDPEATDDARDQRARDTKPSAETPAAKVNPATPQAIQRPGVINDAQRKRMHTIATKHGWKAEIVKAWLLTVGYQSSKDIRVKDYLDLISGLEAGPPADLVGLMDRAAKLTADYAAMHGETH